jgi:Second Messenger Oligonucleotide or Dinucleotide Synthetase domain
MRKVTMAVHSLSENFSYFFSQINPSPTWVAKASSQYNSIKGLLESATGNCAQLNPKIFLQGSYGRDTAIYAINDLDIVALCDLWYPPSQGAGGSGWSRDRIFDALAEPLLNDSRYASKVLYGPNSMCIKLDLGIKVEILPAVFKSGNNDPNKEPFYLYRPERGRWEEGVAKYHQFYLTEKNRHTNGNFIPMVKVLKHIRSLFDTNAVSFHLECLLHAMRNEYFYGGPADYITKVISTIANHKAAEWQSWNVETPCGDRKLFSNSEWKESDWGAFHLLLSTIAPILIEAVNTGDKHRAVQCWQSVLGDDYFPAYE